MDSTKSFSKSIQAKKISRRSVCNKELYLFIHTNIQILLFYSFYFQNAYITVLIPVNRCTSWSEMHHCIHSFMSAALMFNKLLTSILHGSIFNYSYYYLCKYEYNFSKKSNIIKITTMSYFWCKLKRQRSYCGVADFHRCPTLPLLSL